MIPHSPQKGRRSRLLIAAALLLIGTILTTLSIATGNATMLALFIVLPLTFALYSLTLYAGWDDERSGSPVRYYASRGILLAGMLILLASFVRSLL